MSEGSLGKGFGMGALATLGGVLIGWLSMTSVGLVILFGIGVAQIAWMLPLVLYYRKHGERETVKGDLIAAGIVLLLNASCWGLVTSGKWKIAG